jgi:ABC-2 type transport system ATP-binding protein
MITAENLTKNFGDFRAINDISFTINRGEIVGLLGPNGAGKTTTLRILTCFFNPTLGRVKYDNLDVVEDSLKIRQKIGFLPENNPLYEDLKVKEYLTYAAEMHGLSKNKLKEAVTKVMDTCGLKDRANQEIGTLSKGYKQRVGLAQALIHDPEVLIMDEPTEGLDPNQRIEIRDLIKKIGSQKTVILSSHVLSEVEATCNRVLIINQGKIVASGTPDELKLQSARQTKIFLKVEAPFDQVIEAV